MITLASFVVAAVFLGLLLVIKKHFSLYRYKPATSYHYDFSNADGRVESSFKNGVLDLLHSDIDGYDTAFIEVDIKSSFVGVLRQPYIEVVQGDVRWYHYFEYGVQGKRYVNLSETLKSIEPIVFLMNGCRLEESKVTLYLFSNAMNTNETLCVIAPHPDDAEIAAFGLYSNSQNAYILTVSASESGQRMYEGLGLTGYDEAVLKGRTRMMNALSVPLLGGIKPAQCIGYGYFGSTLKKMYQNADTVITSKVKGLNDMRLFREMNNAKELLNPDFEASWRSLVNDLKYTFDKIEPDTIVLPYPHIDKHDDHKYTTIAVIQALKELKYTKGKLLLYTNHHVLSESYPFGRIGSSIDLPPNFKTPLYFNSLYSQPLDYATQMDKIVALESMNVLRPYYPWQNASTILNRLFKNQLNKFYGKRLDYFSRSVRGNELFFVVNIQDIYNDKVLSALNTVVHEV